MLLSDNNEQVTHYNTPKNDSLLNLALIFKKLHSELSKLFSPFMTFPCPTLGHSKEKNLNHMMQINAFLYYLIVEFVVTLALGSSDKWVLSE